MAKRIENYFQLIDVCRSAGLWYVGSFMGEILSKREQWEDSDTKNDFVKYMHTEYSGIDNDISGTRTRINCIIRIIESGYVRDALNMVIEANDNKLGCSQSKINAQATLDAIDAEIIKL